MPSQPLPVILAVQDEPFRRQLEAALGSTGKTPERSGGYMDVYDLTPEQHRNALIVQDVGDDSARLVQVVNDLYRSPYHRGGELLVMCVTSEDTLNRNHGLGWWLIDGHAAVLNVCQRGAQAVSNLISFVYFFERNYEPELTTPLSSYDALLTDVLAKPNDADSLINLAKRLMVWQDDHQMNREMRIALLRHAVLLRPADASARVLYGRALSVHGEKQRAEEELREALRLAPDMAEAHYGLGDLLNWIRPQEALRELHTAIALAPNSETARLAKNHIKSTRLEERQT